MNIQQNVQLENGAQLLLPPNPGMINTAIPNLLAWDSVKAYPLTTKYRFNGKTFVYGRAVVYDPDATGAHAGEFINSQLKAFMGAHSACIIAIDFSTTNVHDHAAGVERIIVEASGVAKDDWKYGEVMLGAEDDDRSMTRSIMGNSATYSLDGTDVVDIDLDIPLSHRTLHDTTTLGVYKSRYAEIEWGGEDYGHTSVVGVPVVSRGSVGGGELTGQWFWLQTWGPCWLQPGVGSCSGDNADEREVVFQSQGRIGVIGSSDRRMRAGFVIPKTKSGTDSYAATPQHLILLQIDP